MIHAESGRSPEDEEKPKPSRSRVVTKKPAAAKSGKDKEGKPAGETAEKNTQKKKTKAKEKEEAEDNAEDKAEDEAEGPEEGKVGKKRETKAKGEGAQKPKQPAASFARRPCPSNNEWSKQRWQSLRDAFELKVKPHLKHYSKHEVRC